MPIKAEKESNVLSLADRRAFMKLPIKERRKIMARQANEMVSHYESETVREKLETLDIVEY
ncbi:MAG: hypothetical protein HPY65_05315 [Syntrophaceae bacterium]|nr:hypothetical protein [Syntrophaceae bacterium]